MSGFPSLGWGLLDWFETYLRVPSGPLYGQPLVLTDEQAQIILDWYALDGRGRFVFRRGAVRRPKKWGKSPLLAAMAVAELAGPTMFDGWDASGEPVGRVPETPWVQIAAVSEDQTDNTYVALYNMLSMGGADDLDLDVGKTKVYLKSGAGRLEPVTAAFGSREGQPITFAVLDETHLWTPRNGGVKLAATIRRNAGPMEGRTFESTNAFRPGDRSVAEQTHKAAEKGQKGLLYSVREAAWVDDLSDRPAMMEQLAYVYGDSSKWVGLERLFDEANDEDTTEADARRFYLNQIVESEDDFVPSKWWDGALGGRGLPEDGTRVALGFDGARFRDSTALIGCELETGRLFVVEVWSKPDGDEPWEVDREAVNSEVAGAFKRWKVGMLLADPPEWESEISRWRARHGKTVWEFPTYKQQRMSPALKAFRSAVKTGEVTHDGDETLAEHVVNARLKVKIPAGGEDDPDKHTWQVYKPAPSRKIDACVAGVLAWQARLDAIAGGALETKTYRAVGF